MNDSEFDAKWRAFVDDDVQAEAPPRIRRAVFAEWDESQKRLTRKRPTARHVVSVLAALGAAVIVVALGVALRERETRRAPATDLNVQAPVIRLAADPRFDTESLQIVRVRVPRAYLQAFGIPLVEPDASSLVDLDFVVGDDGLAREIRRISPVVQAREVQ